MTAALERVRALATASRDLKPSGFTVGVLGRDVPVELVEAAGATAVALRGRVGIDLGPADALLGTGIDPLSRAVLATLLEEQFQGLDGIVLSSDSEASLRTFFVLRELRRVDPSVPVPQVHLVDVMHLPRESSRRYTLAKVREFLATLGDWTGAGIDADAIGAAIEARGEVRDAVRTLSGLRWGRTPRLSGADLACAVLAGGRLPVGDYLALLQALLAETGEQVVHDGIRLVLSGSVHDEPGVIRVIEKAGALVVAEDHDGGDAALDAAPTEPTVEGLARRLAARRPVATRSSIRDRAALTSDLCRASGATAVLSYARRTDDSPAWDFAAQAALPGIKARSIAGQAYGAIDADDLQSALTELSEAMSHA